MYFKPIIINYYPVLISSGLEPVFIVLQTIFQEYQNKNPKIYTSFSYYCGKNPTIFIHILSRCPLRCSSSSQLPRLPDIYIFITETVDCSALCRQDSPITKPFLAVDQEDPAWLPKPFNSKLSPSPPGRTPALLQYTSLSN